jgi:hypothetical protein
VGGRLLLRFGPDFPLDSLPALVRAIPGAVLTPQALKVPLESGVSQIDVLGAVLDRLERGL